MRKSLKKILSTVLVLTLVLSASACGTKKAATTTPTTSASTTTTLPIVSSTLSLNFLSYNWGDANYGNDMPVFKELEKKTNIHLNWTLLPADDNLTKLNLIMSSGQLPDLISYPDNVTSNNKALFDKWAAQGAIIPLDDLIDKYAPHIKAMIDNPPFKIDNLKAELRSSDGHIYSLPRLTQVTCGQIFCIRQDWLDKVGMKAPTTTDELEAVLKAFKDKNVNGKGTVIGLEPEPNNGFDGVTTLMNAFGAHSGFYVDKTDNTIKYGPLESAYKDGLTYVNKLFSEGLIDKNYVSVNSDAFRNKVANNQVGMFYAWPLSGLSFNNTAVKKVDPNASYVAILPVAGPTGIKFKDNAQSAITPDIVITKANKHPIETIKYLDYIYSKEGNTIMNYGVEGTDYTLDSNGNPQFTDNILKNANGNDPGTQRTLEGCQVGLPFIATLASQSAATTDKTVTDAWKLYTDSNVLYTPFPNLSLTDEQNSNISGTLTDINTYVQENTNKFVQGQTSLANFDKFTQTIKSMGIDNILQTYNDAYKKYMELNK